VRLRSIIVDDEPAARDLIAEILATRPDVEVVGSYGDARQALSAIRRDKPELLLLDVQMPGLDGFGVLTALPSDRWPHHSPCCFSPPLRSTSRSRGVPGRTR